LGTFLSSWGPQQLSQVLSYIDSGLLSEVEQCLGSKPLLALKVICSLCDVDHDAGVTVRNIVLQSPIVPLVSKITRESAESDLLRAVLENCDFF